MKRTIRQYLIFSRAERIGLVALCSLLLVLIIIRATMHFWVHPAMNNAVEVKLLAASQPANEQKTISSNAVLPEHQNRKNARQVPLADTIDINSADSATLVQLVGVGGTTAHNILQRRRNNRPLRAISELSEVGGFTQQNLAILKRHLKFGPAR